MKQQSQLECNNNFYMLYELCTWNKECEDYFNYVIGKKSHINEKDSSIVIKNLDKNIISLIEIVEASKIELNSFLKLIEKEYI